MLQPFEDVVACLWMARREDPRFATVAFFSLAAYFPFPALFCERCLKRFNVVLKIEVSGRLSYAVALSRLASDVSRGHSSPTNNSAGGLAKLGA